MTTFDISDSIIPRSDQINAEDLLTGPRTVTITDARPGNDEQPVNIVTAEFGPKRPYKPSKTMRRILIAAWGKNASAYTGRRITIYRDPEVTFGPDKVGGIKISHMSHIDRRLEIMLTLTRGRRGKFIVDPLPDEKTSQPAPSLPERIDRMLKAFGDIDVSEQQVATKLGQPHESWTAADVEQMTVAYQAIRRGEATTADLFPAESADEAAPPVTEDQLIDLAQAREEKFGKSADAQSKWRAWVNETTGRNTVADGDLTEQEAGDLLALAGEK